MEITDRELTLLNFYRASELHGGLVLGRLVQHVRDTELILQLTAHSAEEVMHAQLWTETIIAVGGRPRPTSDTYQARYAAALGAPSSLLEVMALTQVFEDRLSRFHADVRGDEARLELFEQLGIDLAATEEPGEAVRQAGGALAELFLEPAEERRRVCFAEHARHCNMLGE